MATKMEFTDLTTRRTTTRLQRLLVGVAAVAVLATVGILQAPGASADGDQYCESGEVCLADWTGSYYAIWSEDADELWYPGRYYDQTSQSIDNNSSFVDNDGNYCGVTVFSGTYRTGSSAYIPLNSGWVYFGNTNVAVNAASSHDFCWVA